ncbi:hypothetical protein [Acetonema longum]|uniref:Uncharacterized protein n=1 Tax=Acetonema longum DSM 6540 TaxID=1009370 RepID=F7NPG0_9FIRM|nr:hypothetical protein [Acetonema longum]EGO62122.1 hypothetical protein ALO_20027 [Acetonema longum DSM 6540]
MRVWLGIIVLGGAILVSIWLRIRYYRHNFELNEHTVRQSPLSMALQELVGTAGGVYLSIIMLISFLKIDLPQTLELFEVSFDPLALFAILSAVVQPLWKRFV